MRKITEEISFYLNVFDDIKMCFRCVEPFSIPVQALKYLDFYYQMSARCVKPYRNRNMFQAFQPLISTNQSFSWAKCSSRGIFDPMVSNIHKNWRLIFLSPYGGVLNSVRSNQCIIQFQHSVTAVRQIVTKYSLYRICAHGHECTIFFVTLSTTIFRARTKFLSLK